MRTGPGASWRALALGALALPLGFGAEDLSQTETLIWVMTGLAVAGSIITFAFLVYAIWKFKDPNMRRRRHG